jgi:hypothetical protein
MVFLLVQFGHLGMAMVGASSGSVTSGSGAAILVGASSGSVSAGSAGLVALFGSVDEATTLDSWSPTMIRQNYQPNRWEPVVP